MPAEDGSTYPNLMSSLAVGSRTVPNRTALAATVTNYGRANQVTDRWIDFLVERAKGGTGMVITEVIAVDPDARAQGATVTGYDDENLPGFRRAAEEVEAAGALLIAQLWHPGRQQLWLPGASPKGVSDQPDAYSWTVPHVMSEAELRKLAGAFVTAAERFWKCGFGGVELHGAHGYLMTQILSPWSNTRRDAYGGSTENRCRFVREVAEEIRARCGDDFVLGVKLPGDEGVTGGIDLEEACAITDNLAATGCFDYLAYSQGNFSLSLERHVPDMYFRPGHFIDIHKAVRPHARGIPVMAIGRIDTPDLAEKIVAEGYADLVGMSRALIADADFAEKARTGAADTIRPSLYDNVSWGEIHAGKPLEEPQNPMLGHKGESGWTPAPAKTKRRIAVVGAGPAGLEAAWTAAARGHAVTLYGAGPQIGGRFAAEAGLPGRAELKKLTRYFDSLLTAHGVERKLGAAVTADTLQKAGYDHVILAAGATQRRPGPLDRADGGAISGQEAMARLAEGEDPPGGDGAVAVYDHDQSAATYALVDALAGRAERLLLLTPRPHLAQGVNYCSAIGVFRRLYSARVEIMPATDLAGFGNGTLKLTNPYTGEEREETAIDLLVYSTPRRADDGLAETLDEMRIPVVRIGDCMSPRNMIAAIHEGRGAGLTV